MTTQTSNRTPPPGNNQPRNQPQQPDQEPLAPSTADPNAPKPGPANYSAEFLVETAEGFHVSIRGEGMTPRDVGAWMKQFSTALKSQGFKPVRRDVEITMPAAATGGGPASSGEAKLVESTGDEPHRCSLHGPLEFREGTYKNGAKAGKPYKVWSCKERGCKVAKWLS